MILEETKRVRKGISDQIDALERKAFDAGVKEAAEKRTQVYSEGAKEMKDAMNTILLADMIKHGSITDDTLKFLVSATPEMIFNIVDAVEDEEEELKKGDVVKDPSGRECIVTNTDTHIHVIYDDGKTHKWDKNSGFERLPEEKVGVITFFGED